jgi:hypothetical protein
VEYQETWLWQAAFVGKRDDASEKEQTYFAERYRSMREKAEHLVSRIANDVAGLTAHDVTHLGA